MEWTVEIRLHTIIVWIIYSNCLCEFCIGCFDVKRKRNIGIEKCNSWSLKRVNKKTYMLISPFCFHKRCLFLFFFCFAVYRNLETVIIHDAVRPLIDELLVKEMIQAANDVGVKRNVYIHCKIIKILLLKIW